MDATPTQTPDPLTQIIANDLAGYTQLLALLSEERKLLIERDVDGMDRNLMRKHTLVTALEHNHQQRLLLLKKAGLKDDAEGVKALLSGHENEQELTNTWQEVHSLLLKCQKQNEVNARIAHRAQATNRQILSILRGDNGASNLYRKDGQRIDRGSLPITRV